MLPRVLALHAADFHIPNLVQFELVYKYKGIAQLCTVANFVWMHVLVFVFVYCMHVSIKHLNSIHDKVVIRKPHIGVQEYNSDRRGMVI